MQEKKNISNYLQNADSVSFPYFHSQMIPTKCIIHAQLKLYMDIMCLLVYLNVYYFIGIGISKTLYIQLFFFYLQRRHKRLTTEKLFFFHFWIRSMHLVSRVGTVLSRFNVNLSVVTSSLTLICMDSLYWRDVG